MSAVGNKAVEALIGAWADCRPIDQAVDLSLLPIRLPAIAAHLPRIRLSVPDTCLARFLGQQGNDEPTLFEILTEIAENEKVFFLHFWYAFDVIVATMQEGDGEPVFPAETLHAELQVIRDVVLHLLERRSQNRERDATLSVSRVSKIMLTAASRSKAPGFWQAAACSARASHWKKSRAKDEERRMGVAELSTLMLSMLHDVLAHDVAASMEIVDLIGNSKLDVSLTTSPPRRGKRSKAVKVGDIPSPLRTASQGNSSSGASSDCCDRIDVASVHSSAPAKPGPVLSAEPASPSQEDWAAVFLHVYDVSTGEVVRWLNDVLAHTRSPLKFGGAFHAGVEVNGLEWCFGYCPGASAPGVECVRPKSHPNHRYRQTIYLGRTPLTADRIASVLGDLVEEYPGSGYSLLRRNCCHFADEFCHRLQVGGIPGWVHRLARFGASADGALQHMMAGLSSETAACKGPISSVCTQGAVDQDSDSAWVGSCCLQSWSVHGQKNLPPI
mmetsp:Transcript_63781/g.152089  ORF Transcript_63781/g.152089 Transcript_63781/m.152089 type:complete len:499 (-) Transcript_63781:16-1512(-)